MEETPATASHGSSSKHYDREEDDALQIDRDGNYHQLMYIEARKHDRPFSLVWISTVSVEAELDKKVDEMEGLRIGNPATS